MKVPSKFLTLTMIGLAALLSSCVDTESTFHLNPDKSGKVEHMATFTKEAGKWAEEDPAEAFAKAVIYGAEGIEAWDDVFYRLDGDTVEFKGVGYFADVNKVRLAEVRTENSGVVGTSTPRIEWTEDGVLQLHDGEGNSKPVISGLPPLNDEESNPKADRLISALLTSKNKVTIVTGGTFSDAEAFTLVDGQHAEFAYNPKDLDKVKKEDREGLDPGKSFYDQPALLKLVTGAEAVKLKIDPGTKPLFDYRKAVLGADIKVDPETAGGWRKLESLD